MSGTPSSIEITQHAVDRYERVVVARASHQHGDARSEIRELLRTGTPTTAPSWLPTAGRPTDDTRRYLVFGQDRALVLNTKLGDEGQDVIVVLTVITRPVVEPAGA